MAFDAFVLMERSPALLVTCVGNFGELDGSRFAVEIELLDVGDNCTVLRILDNEFQLVVAWVELFFTMKLIKAKAELLRRPLHIFSRRCLMTRR